METHVPWLALCVCCNHPTSGPTLWSECGYASVHVFMSTGLQMSPETTMHSYMETWAPMYGTVFVSQSPHFCSHSLIKICTCTGTCIYVHPTPNVSSNLLWIVTWKPGCSCVSLCVLQSLCLWSHTLFKMCICI